MGETNETNNCRASTITVRVTGMPDLIVSSLGNPPVSVARGSSFTVTDTTRNQGGAVAGASTTRYRLSTNNVILGTDPLLTGSRALPTLATNSNSTGSVRVTVPTTIPLGTYFLGACADSLGVVTESSEANNCRSSTTMVQVTP